MSEFLGTSPLRDKSFWRIENSEEIAGLMGVGHDELFLEFLREFIKVVIPTVRITVLLSGVATQQYNAFCHQKRLEKRVGEGSRACESQVDSRGKQVEGFDDDLCYYLIKCLKQFIEKA